MLHSVLERYQCLTSFLYLEDKGFSETMVPMYLARNITSQHILDIRCCQNIKSHIMYDLFKYISWCYYKRHINEAITYEHKQKQHYVQEHFQLHNLFKQSYCLVSAFSFSYCKTDRETQKTELEDSIVNTVSTHQTTWHCILEDTRLNIHCHKKLTSHNERQFANNDALFCNRKYLEVK